MPAYRTEEIACARGPTSGTGWEIEDSDDVLVIMTPVVALDLQVCVPDDYFGDAFGREEVSARCSIPYFGGWVFFD